MSKTHLSYTTRLLIAITMTELTRVDWRLCYIKICREEWIPDISGRL